MGDKFVGYERDCGWGVSVLVRGRVMGNKSIGFDTRSRRIFVSNTNKRRARMDAWCCEGPSRIRSAIDRVRRASDRGNVQDVQMQFQQSQRESVGTGDAFIMASFQAGARQRTVVEEFFQRGIAQLACAVEIDLPLLAVCWDSFG